MNFKVCSIRGGGQLKGGALFFKPLSIFFNLHYQYGVLHYTGVKETRNFPRVLYFACKPYLQERYYINFLLKVSPKSDKSYVA